MFHPRDTLFGKKDEATAKDPKSDPKSFNTSSNRSGAYAARTDTTPSTSTAPTPASLIAAPQTTEAPPASGSKLIVGPDIKLKGVEITDCDTLVVEGRVEASMDSRVIQIAESGVYNGTVGIDIAEIHGHFDGELTARKQLVVHKTARISGKIRYGKISIEEGGEISGDIATLGGGTASHNADAPHVDIMTPYDPFAQKGKAAAKPATTPH